MHEKNFCIKHENIDCKDNTLTSARAKYSWSRASIITRISPLESLMSISSAPQSSQGHFHQYHQYVLSDNIGLHFDPKKYEIIWPLDKYYILLGLAQMRWRGGQNIFAFKCTQIVEFIICNSLEAFFCSASCKTIIRPKSAQKNKILLLEVSQS